jgi:hypothetical protein
MILEITTFGDPWMAIFYRKWQKMPSHSLAF